MERWYKKKNENRECKEVYREDPAAVMGIYEKITYCGVGIVPTGVVRFANNILAIEALVKMLCVVTFRNIG